MRLKKLKLLSSFRGLPKGYEINFSQENNSKLFLDPICFIGLNGSGKSNVLEAISEIFYYLEDFSKAQKSKQKTFATSFGFLIEYFLPAQTTYEVGLNFGIYPDKTIDDLNKRKRVEIRKEMNELPHLKVSYFENNEVVSTSSEIELFTVLPKNILGYSSGMNELLSNPFIRMDFQYYSDLKAKTNEAAFATLGINRLYYLNYSSSKLVTVCNFIFEEDSTLPLKTELGISSLESFSIRLSLTKKKFERDFLPSELNKALFSFQKIDPLFEEINISSSKIVDKRNYTFDFNINAITRKAFIDEFKTPQLLFRVLYYFQILNLELIGKKTVDKVKNTVAKSRDNLSDLIPKKEKDKLIFVLDNISFKKINSNKNIHFKQFSDGEHQLLHVLGSISMFDEKTTLFLFDEPTTHFNPEWRSKFIYLINEVANNRINEQELLLTTHSPFIVSDCKRDKVIQTLNDGKKTYRIPENETYGASIRFLLNKLFDQKNSIGKFSHQDLMRLYEKVNTLESENDIEEIKEYSLRFGDSPEKMILFNKLNIKIKELGLEK